MPIPLSWTPTTWKTPILNQMQYVLHDTKDPDDPLLEKSGPSIRFRFWFYHHESPINGAIETGIAADYLTPSGKRFYTKYIPLADLVFIPTHNLPPNLITPHFSRQ